MVSKDACHGNPRNLAISYSPKGGDVSVCTSAALAVTLSRFRQKKLTLPIMVSASANKAAI